MRTYELLGSDHKNGCTGLAVVPKSQNKRVRRMIVEEALFLQQLQFLSSSLLYLNCIPALICGLSVYRSEDRRWELNR